MGLLTQEHFMNLLLTNDQNEANLQRKRNTVMFGSAITVVVVRIWVS